MGRNFVFKCFSFFSCFHAESGTTNLHRTGMSDRSKNFQKKFASVEKNRFEVFDFSSNFERVKRASRLVFA